MNIAVFDLGIAKEPCVDDRSVRLRVSDTIIIIIIIIIIIKILFQEVYTISTELISLAALKYLQIYIDE